MLFAQLHNFETSKNWNFATDVPAAAAVFLAYDTRWCKLLLTYQPEYSLKPKPYISHLRNSPFPQCTLSPTSPHSFSLSHSWTSHLSSTRGHSSQLVQKKEIGGLLRSTFALAHILSLSFPSFTPFFLFVCFVSFHVILMGHLRPLLLFIFKLFYNKLMWKIPIHYPVLGFEVVTFE